MWWIGGVASCLALAGVVVGAAEAPPGPRAEPTPRPRLVVRTGVELVQVDAVVLDKDGRYVTDLKVEDFEILQDGKPRPASYCEYVIAAPADTLAPRRTPKPGAGEEEAPARVAPVAREDVRRVRTFVVDDLNLSAGGLRIVAGALRQTVREDVLPGDLVAVVRTSGGAGVLQQLTNDPRVLEAAVADVAGRPSGLGFEGPEADAGALDQRATRDRAARFTEAGLETMAAVLESLRGLPGRKSMVVFSERMSITDRLIDDVTLESSETFDEADGGVVAAVRRVTDLANRASVVLYTIDPSGLAVVEMGAHRNELAGPTAPLGGEAWLGYLNRTREDREAAQSGLRTLAERTGGVHFPRQNRVEAAIAEVMEDQKGYYVVGYVPEAGTFDAAPRQPAFHKLELRVRRPGLRVRSRGAFSRVSDDEEAARPMTTGAPALAAALLSPFAAQSIPIRLTPVFGYDAKGGYVVRAYVHVAAAALAFTRAEGGGQRAQLKLVAGGFGGKGVVLPPLERDVTIGVEADKIEGIQAAGMVLEFTVPLARPGSYQLRVAVRDAGSGQIGMATQFLDVPDLARRRLALSGVVLGSLAVRGSSAPGDVAVATAARLSPAVRRFAPGADLSYAFAVYHPALDKATRRPGVTTRLRLVRDGKDALLQEVTPAVQHPLPAVEAKGTKPVPVLIVAGTFVLPAALEPGEYALQVLVTDTLAKGAPRASQWTSLEVAVP